MEITLKEILPPAYREHRAILHFNIHTLEDIEGVVEAGYELDLPVIVACTPRVLNTLGGRSIVGVYRSLADYCSTPVVLHLDHTTELRDIWRAISSGFTSVMIDGSRLPYEENVQLTRTVVEVARAAGISVEGEIGAVPGKEDDLKDYSKDLTDPDMAYSFVLETEVDALAVSIGSAHGFYKELPELDFERLSSINKKVNIPLVLHGGTGIPVSDIKKAISLGIAKVNIGTELLALVTETYREVSRLDYDALEIVDAGKRKLKERVKELLLEIER
ncbi:MAG TPA: class II fructose-bisphosphate aldolase [bacterium]|nr:class II fructose-bisphosphate aldolase [bacterium]